MTEKILAALAQLDPKNDNHWTVDNLPRLEAVKMLASDQSITRAAIDAASPGFVRPGSVVAPAAKDLVAPVLQEPVNVLAQAAEGSGPGLADEEGQPGEEEAGLAQAFEDAKARLVAATARKDAAAQEFAQAREEVDRFIEKIEKDPVGGKLSDHLAGYFDGQAKLRDERVRRLAALKGIDLRDILPSRARIDQAMSRNTSRGAKRPVRL